MCKKELVYVLQIGMTRNIGGLETYLMQQFEHMDKDIIRYDFVNITGEHEIAFSDKIRQAGSTIYNICSRHKNPLLHYWRWIKLLKKNKNKYKAIVLNTNSLEYVFPMFIAKIFYIEMRVIHSHNAGFERKIGLLRKLLIAFNKLLLNFSATHYFACSKKAGEWMFGKEKNFKIIHNAIETDKYRYSLQKRQDKRKELGLEDKFVIGHIGRFSYQKNHDFLIDIFSEIHKILPEAELLLIGDAVDDKSYLNEAKQKVKNLCLEKNVKFLGMRNDVQELMQAMDCFILPSKFEGLPLVGIEAQTAGLPCYFSDVITEEVKITDLVNFISLNKSSLFWAKEVVKSKTFKRKDVSNEIIEAGYDINTEIKKIEKFYKDRYIYNENK
ncbi:glycosyltransferase family 1 protein [Megamonas hypermegale]|nr:glycosyltransferase family 1 protein [Megamonas hypermegale]